MSLDWENMSLGNFKGIIVVANVSWKSHYIHFLSKSGGTCTIKRDWDKRKKFDS